jgi:hypothetical protein
METARKYLRPENRTILELEPGQAPAAGTTEVAP